jgi:hypothetical protein
MYDNVCRLVVSTILKTISQMGRIIPYIMENKKCLKPPTKHITNQWKTQSWMVDWERFLGAKTAR